MKRFPVIIRSGEDGWFVVSCPALPGCISQGRSREEALQNIAEAIQLCLEDTQPAEEWDAVEIALAS